MTRKIALILITLFFALIFGALVFSYFKLLPKQGDLEDGGQTFRGFFPFGDNSDDFKEDEFRPVTDGADGTFFPRLRKISAEPVVAFITYTATSSSTSTPNKEIVRFMMRSTGHIFDIAEDSNDLERVTNTTIPKVQEASFLNTDNIVARFLKSDNDSVETYLGKIVKEGDEETKNLEGVYLSPDIIDIDVSPLGKLFYLTQNPSGVSGTVLDIKTNKGQKVFESPLREWKFKFAGENFLIYHTKPSANVPGFLFNLDLSTGVNSKLLSGPAGLSVATAENPNTALYSENVNGRIVLKQANFVSGILSEKGISGLADKCSWEDKMIYCAAPAKVVSGNLPDAWYKGDVFFNDNIWEINTENNSIRQLVSLNEISGEEIDAIDLRRSSKGGYLVFINKRDGALWSLRLEGLDEALE